MEKLLCGCGYIKGLEQSNILNVRNVFCDFEEIDSIDDIELGFYSSIKKYTKYNIIDLYNILNSSRNILFMIYCNDEYTYTTYCFHIIDYDIWKTFNEDYIKLFPSTFEQFNNHKNIKTIDINKYNAYQTLQSEIIEMNNKYETLNNKYEQLKLELSLKPSCEECGFDGGELFKQTCADFYDKVQK